MSSILDKRLILIAGKGGVGRSTVAAAIAAACARKGRRTLLFEANANDRFGAFFGTQAVGTRVTRLAERLYAVNTNPAAALEEYGMMVLRFKRVYKMVFENRVTRYFLRAIPGLDDYSILGKAWYHTTEGKRAPEWDTVVFDMPASGHSLSMLRIPSVILDTVPEGPLTRDARSLRQLLVDQDRTALVLVTLAEEMPTNEARELSTALHDELDIHTARIVVNQVHPDRFGKGTPAEQILDALCEHVRAADQNEAVDDELAAAAQHGHLARSRRALNERYLDEIAGTITAPRTILPLLFTPTIGPSEIHALSTMLQQEL